MATYISTSLSKNRKKVIVWERDGDNRYHVEYDAPYYFFQPDRDGEHKSVKGEKVRKLTFDNPREFFEHRKSLIEEGTGLFESDISPELKVLSDRYYGKPISDDLHITFYDIEVDYDPQKGHANSNNPYARISSIALYHLHSDRAIVLATPPKKGEWKGATIDDLPPELLDGDTEIIICKDEKEILTRFFEEIEDSDVISGWNSEFFDDPYIYLRTLQILGDNCTNLMNLPGADKDVKVDETEKFGTLEMTVKPVGRIWIDYMQMMKKFDSSERSSYALESVAAEELDNMEKLDFGKSLYRLYHENFDEFIKYNIRDTEILKGLETKFRYMNLAIQFSHMVTNHMHSVLGTVSTSDTAILNFCKYETGERLVLPDSKEAFEDDSKFAGAFVLDPQVGLHEYVASIDIKSLYPSAIRAVNISPDTIVGQFFENEHAVDLINQKTNDELTILYENSMDESMSAKEWHEYLRKRKLSISAHGTVFEQDHNGIIPAILTSWFESRIEMQKEKTKHADLCEQYEEDSPEYKENKKLVEYYDNIQYLKKIQLNSMYGVFGNKYFRFFDIRLAESTTKTGKAILKHMIKVIAQAMDGEYTFPSESIIYGDTDSVYFKTQTDNKEDAILIGNTLTRLVNKSYPKFMSNTFNCQDGRETYIIAEKEVVSDRGIFVKKKHYLLHLVDKDGRDVDEMKVMGLQIKKTNIPKFIRTAITDCFERYLKGEDWKTIKKDIVDFKTTLEEMDILELGKPSGVNKVEYYTDEFNNPSGLTIPSHVKASILYNTCLHSYEDGESMNIRSGMKIKQYFFYKQKKFGKFNAIAIPTDLDLLPDWVEHFLPYIDRNRQIETLVDKPIRNILEAIGEAVPNKKNVLADELLDFGE